MNIKSISTLVLIVLPFVFLSCSTSTDNSKLTTRQESLKAKQIETNTTQKLDDSLSYSFIKSIFTLEPDQSLNPNIIYSEATNCIRINNLKSPQNEILISTIYAEPMDPVLLKVDSNEFWHMQKQAILGINKKWNYKKLGIRPQPDKNYMEKLYNTQNNLKIKNSKCSINLGIPVFNRKKNIAIIYKEQYCNLSIEKGSYRYDLINNEWKLTAKYCPMILVD